MAKTGYIGSSGGTAKKIKAIYIGVNGIARKVTKAYVGVNGVARQWWATEVHFQFPFSNESLTDSLIEFNAEDNGLPKT